MGVIDYFGQLLRPWRLLGIGGSAGCPAGVLLRENGFPVLNENGDYICWEGYSESVTTQQGETYSMADAFTDGGHGTGSHWHNTTIAGQSPPAIDTVGQYAEVGGFFGDEEVRGVSEFDISGLPATASQVLLKFTVTDLTTAEGGIHFNAIGGLYGQDPLTAPFQVLLFEANGTEELADFQQATFANAGTVDPTTLTAGQEVSIDITTHYNARKALGDDWLGARLQLQASDPNAGAIVFQDFELEVTHTSAPGSAPVIDGVPTISGTTSLGATLTATAASVTGSPTPTRFWQWIRNGIDIAGATSSTYVLTEADAGVQITVRQTETNNSGVATATSDPEAIPAWVLLMDVRRSNDNLIKTIQAAAGGFIDETELGTHVSTNSGFVSEWLDQSGNSFHVEQSDTTRQPRIVNSGTVDSGLVFDGNGDYLESANSIGANRQFLVFETWIYLGTKQNGQILFELSADFNLNNGGVLVGYDFYNENFNISVKTTSGTNIKQFSPSVPRSAWRHLVCYVDFVAKTQKVVVDGVLLTASSVSGLTDWPTYLANAPVFIGARTGGIFPIEATLNDTRIILPSVALSDGELTAIYGGTIPSGTAAYFKAKEIAPAVPEISGVPTISGDTDVGDLLTATAASVTGIPTPVRTWQWTRNGVDISGATNATYTIQAADDGTAIRVRQIETNAEGSDTATSDPVSVVDVFAPVISGVPTISGTTGEGDTLTASPASVTGVPTPTRTWQWYRDAVAISGATSITYTLVSADLGTDITVVQTETNAEGTDTATSVATSIPSAPASATAMRVRESVGNSEADIPLAVDGFVDETALTTHTGAASGFVTNWHDQSGNDNDATQATTTAQPRIVNAGTVDEALVFDGSNDFLSAGARVTTGSVSKLFVSAWIRTSNASSNTKICGEWIVTGNNRIWVLDAEGTSGQLRFIASGDGIGSVVLQGVSNVVDGQWHHVAVYYNAGAASLFIDGVEESVSLLFSMSLFNGVNSFLIGTFNTATTGFWNGSITDVRVAEGAAADDHAANIAGIYAGTYEGSPVAWYKATEVAHSMRVRESSGNAERNILIADGGYVDETDLLDHVGANSGFVTSWRDRSGLGNHAVQTTQVSQPRIVNAGTVDEALVFDGNDWLSAGARVTTGTVTKLFVSAWVKSSSASATQIIASEYHSVGNQRSWAFALYSTVTSGAEVLLSANGTSSSSVFKVYGYPDNVRDGQWHQLAFHFNEGALSLYYDGELVTPVVGIDGTVNSLFNTTANLNIGSWNEGSFNFCNGSITDVRVAEGAAADDHAANIAGIYAGTYEGSPVAWYKATEITP